MINTKVQSNIENKTLQNGYLRYGLKIKSLFLKDKYKELKYIKQASGNIIITEAGIYHIECIGDTFIEHNIINGIIHIIVETKNDNIQINIKSHGELYNIDADILHIVNINHKNIIANVICNAIIEGDTNIIYRSNIKSIDTASGQAIQKADFLNLSSFATISAIPCTDVTNTNVIAEHAVAIHNIDKDLLFFMSLYGFDKQDIKTIIKDSFLLK